VTLAVWESPVPAYLWQVTLHSVVAGLTIYAWVRRLRLPSGRAKRQLLGVLLVLPLFTAAVPGRDGAEFRERRAWLDSGRILAIPVGAGVRVAHLVVAGALVMVGITVWQELVPALRRRDASPEPVPEGLARLARDLPAWGRGEIAVSPSRAIELATGGWPRRSRLIVSRGALDRLTEEELAVALRHEDAHWRARRWVSAHALFVVRLVQCYNPVALLAFRAYCHEVEIDCDAEALADGDRRVLARTLLKVYESTDRRDVAARASLKRRVEVLLGERRRDDDALPLSAVIAASAILGLVLPWLV
jgi:beta-lactamase regulating signal transducer with metallopeptidase domain